MNLDNIMETLDMMQFFGGQRAGRELWADKPEAVQNEDIDNFNKNIDAIRGYIESLQTKLAKAVEDMTMLGRLGANVCPVCEHYNHGEGSRDACISCITQKEADCFRWRGMRDG